MQCKIQLDTHICIAGIGEGSLKAICTIIAATPSLQSLSTKPMEKWVWPWVTLSAAMAATGSYWFSKTFAGEIGQVKTNPELHSKLARLGELMNENLDTPGANILPAKNRCISFNTVLEMVSGRQKLVLMRRIINIKHCSRRKAFRPYPSIFLVPSTSKLAHACVKSNCKMTTHTKF